MSFQETFDINYYYNHYFYCNLFTVDKKCFKIVFEKKAN